MAGFAGHDRGMTIDRDGLTQERADLLETLRKHRGFLRQTLAGVSDEQAAERTTVSELCLGGLVKHVGLVESNWVDFIERGAAAMAPPDEAAMEAHAAGFRMLPGETVE